MPIIRSAWSGGGMTMWHAMWNSKNRHSERGFAVFIVVAWLTLCLFVGMAVDIGILLRYRRAMQNACDTGALAGAQNLKSNPTTVPGIARSYASADMNQNNINSDTLTAATLNSSNQPDTTKPDRVRVDVHATVPTFFFRLVTNAVAVAVECTAKIEPVKSVTGLVPIGLNYTTWLNYYNSNIKNGQCDITVPISERPAYCQTMTDMIGLVGSWGAGNDGLLCLPPAGNTNCGASEWNNEFTNGSTGSYCFDANQVTAVPDPNGPSCALAQTKPGYDDGQVKQAINNRCAFAAPPASQQQILIVPLINPSSAGAGRNTVEIWGFAAFQLSCPQNGGKSITGSFVSLVTFQAQGCDPATDANCHDTGVETVRLIQ